MKAKILILALVLFLGAAGVGLAGDAGVTRPRWVLSSGASDSAGGEGITLRATLGQPMVGVIAGGGGQEVTLGQGFWHGGIAGYSIYLPLVLRYVDGLVRR